MTFEDTPHDILRKRRKRATNFVLHDFPSRNFPCYTTFRPQIYKYAFTARVFGIDFYTQTHGATHGEPSERLRLRFLFFPFSFPVFDYEFNNFWICFRFDYELNYFSRAKM